MSLEQDLGLTDGPRGRPSRRPGDERSHNNAPDYYFIIYKINPSSPGSEDPFVPGFLDPDGSRNHLLSSRSFVSRKIYFHGTVYSSHHYAPLRHLENSFGLWVFGGCCLGEGWLLPLLVRAAGAGGVGSLRLRPLFVPRIAVPSRPPRLLWVKSIYRPLSPLSLPLSLYPRR